MPYKDPQKQKEAHRRSEAKLADKRRLAQKAKRDEIRQWCAELRTNVPCADCSGIFHFSAMQWDHLPGTKKIASVREMANCFQSRRLVEEEIAKCELVCANCHAIRTYERLQETI